MIAAEGVIFWAESWAAEGGIVGVQAANASQGDFPCDRCSTSPEDKQGKRAKRSGISAAGKKIWG